MCIYMLFSGSNLPWRFQVQIIGTTFLFFNSPSKNPRSSTACGTVFTVKLHVESATHS